MAWKHSKALLQIFKAATLLCKSGSVASIASVIAIIRSNCNDCGITNNIDMF